MPSNKPPPGGEDMKKRILPLKVEGIEPKDPVVNYQKESSNFYLPIFLSPGSGAKKKSQSKNIGTLDLDLRLFDASNK